MSKALALLALLAAGAALADVECVVSTYSGTYTGRGYDTGSALAQARDNCILAENNSRVCLSAPTSCRDSYVPVPPPGGNARCLLSTRDYGVFTGYGWNAQAALDDARNQCMAIAPWSECDSAPFTCRE